MNRKVVVNVALADFVFDTEENAIAFFKLASNAVKTKYVKVSDDYYHVVTTFHDPSLKTLSVYTQEDIDKMEDIKED